MHAKRRQAADLEIQKSLCPVFSELTCLLRENRIKKTTGKEEQVALSWQNQNRPRNNRQEHIANQIKLPASELTGSNPICSQGRSQASVWFLRVAPLARVSCDGARGGGVVVVVAVVLNGAAQLCALQWGGGQKAAAPPLSSKPYVCGLSSPKSQSRVPV
jgi:hypothetical protein